MQAEAAVPLTAPSLQIWGHGAQGQWEASAPIPRRARRSVWPWEGDTGAGPPLGFPGARPLPSAGRQIPSNSQELSSGGRIATHLQS